MQHSSMKPLVSDPLTYQLKSLDVENPTQRQNIGQSQQHCSLQFSVELAVLNLIGFW